MARQIGSRVTRRRDTPAPLADTSVEWSAALIQPRRMLASSVQSAIVTVTAPMVLDGQVSVAIADRTYPAEWLGESGQHRRARALLTGVPAGRRAVRVVVAQGGERADLEAGLMTVT